MGDRVTLEKIFAIMRRLLLIRKSGLDPVPVKGTTRHECYRALYEIQELLETRRYFGRHLPQTHADCIRAMTDEELAKTMHSTGDCPPRECPYAYADLSENGGNITDKQCVECWLDWLKQEAKT